MLIFPLVSSTGSSTYISFGQRPLSHSDKAETTNPRSTGGPVQANRGHILLTTLGTASPLWTNNILGTCIKLLGKISCCFLWGFHLGGKTCETAVGPVGSYVAQLAWQWQSPEDKAGPRRDWECSRFIAPSSGTQPSLKVYHPQHPQPFQLLELINSL